MSIDSVVAEKLCCLGGDCGAAAPAVLSVPVVVVVAVVVEAVLSSAAATDMNTSCIASIERSIVTITLLMVVVEVV